MSLMYKKPIYVTRLDTALATDRIVPYGEDIIDVFSESLRDEVVKQLLESPEGLEEKVTIQELVNLSEAVDDYILDDENVILVFETKCDSYKMGHYKLVDNKLVKVNEWNLEYYSFTHNIENLLIKENGLFKIPVFIDDDEIDALYDYKNSKFVIPKGMFDNLLFGDDNNHLEKYDGILGVFKIRSDEEPDDVCSYINPITNKQMQQDFNVQLGNYYAILELDGTIRSNKLFRGNEFSKIEEVIDLSAYESLENFKNIIKNQCNEEKKKIKEKYYQMLKQRNDDSVSPYLDSEVAKVAFAKKKQS